MPTVDATQYPQEIGALMIAAAYAVENPLTFQSWAEGKGYILTHHECEHTEAEHAEAFAHVVNQGVAYVAQVFSIGQFLIDGLGGSPVPAEETGTEVETESGQYL